MQFHNVQRKTYNKTKKRVGRGGKRGTYSGRGLKGQKSRAGRKIRPQMRDTIKKIPKKRGYRFASIKVKPLVVNIALLDVVFKDGETITPQMLVDKLQKKKKGRLQIKILGKGTLTKALSVSGCLMSRSAHEKIEQAGGSVK